MNEINIQVTERKKEKLTQDYLKQLVTYDSGTGKFTSKVNRATVKVGDILGYIDSLGYVKLKIDRITYQAHRLAFLYMDGAIPNVIDHIDNNPSNNAWNNLRAATKAQNSHNSQMSSSNTTGVKGLSYNKTSSSYLAYIMKEGKPYTKRFSCKAWGETKARELAIAWLRDTREILHKDFTNHG